MGRVLKPFDVISAPYVSLDGSIKEYADGVPQRALFMVLAVDYDNVTAVKITSQNNKEYLNHSYMITKSSNFFLKTDSYIQLDKFHTLSVECASYLGYVDKPSRYSIYKILDGYLTNLSSNVKRFVDPIRRNSYVSPNRRK